MEQHDGERTHHCQRAREAGGEHHCYERKDMQCQYSYHQEECDTRVIAMECE